MGSVWLAVHLELGSRVAIKFQHVVHADSQEGAARFRREARAAAQLRSVNIVHTYDYGLHEGAAYIVMEYLAGESLRVRLAREHHLVANVARTIIRQVAAALEIAHRAGVVHRDIKPSNLFLVQDGSREVVKLLDFGIAKWTDPDDLETAVEHTSSLTVLGSAPYMSPEQARGQPVDYRADLWSLSVVAYEMLLGALPFVGPNLLATLRKVEQATFEAPSVRLGIECTELNRFFVRALSPNIEARFPSARDLAAAFDRATRQFSSDGAPYGTEYTDQALGRQSDTVTMGASAVSPERAGSNSHRRLEWIIPGVALAAVVAWAWSSGSDGGASPTQPATSATSSGAKTELRPTRELPALASNNAATASAGIQAVRDAASAVPVPSSSAARRREPPRRRAAEPSSSRGPAVVIDPFSGLAIPSGT